MKRTLRYYPGCTTNLEWMRDFQESVRHYWIEKLNQKETPMVKRQWEYRKVIFPAVEYDMQMRLLGTEGWEAYHMFEGDMGRFEVHLKRPAESEKQLLTE